MRQRVVRALRPLHAVSVENPAHPGTPDVNYCHGWIELKAASWWPERVATPLRVPHFTQQQKIWLMRRHRAGGRADVLLMVGNEWLRFSAEAAFEHLGKCNREDLILHSSTYWAKTPTDEQLLSCFDTN